MATHTEAKKPTHYNHLWEFITIIAFVIILSVAAILLTFFLGILVEHLTTAPQ